MSEHVYFITLCLPLGAIVTIFAMRAYSAYMQAKARFEHGEAYRQMAEKAVSLQTEIQSSLADIKGRLASVEKILKDVE